MQQEIETYQTLSGINIIGKRVTDEAVLAKYAHIPNAIVLDETLVINIQYLADGNGGHKARVDFIPLALAVKGQGPATIAFSASSVIQFEGDDAYKNGYESAISPIIRPDSQKIIV